MKIVFFLIIVDDTTFLYGFLFSFHHGTFNKRLDGQYLLAVLLSLKKKNVT